MKKVSNTKKKIQQTNQREKKDTEETKTMQGKEENVKKKNPQKER